MTRLRLLAVAALLVLMTLAVFHGSVGHDFTNFDDNTVVTENRHLRSGLTAGAVRWAFTTTYWGNWMPVTWLSHLLDVQFYGMNASGHHLTSVVLHCLSAVVLFLALRAMTGALWRSFFVAALFAVHPLHVEPVAWVAARRDVLSTLFWMLTLLLYQRYVSRPCWGRYLPTVAACGLGLMSKPMLVTLPLVLLVLDWWPLNRFSLSAPSGSLPAGGGGRYSAVRLVIEKAPLLVMAAAVSAVTYRAQEGIGAIKDLGAFSLGFRLQGALLSYGKYLGKTFWPRELAVPYPVHGEGVASWPVVVAGVLMVSVTLWAFAAWRRRPYLAAGWLWYAGTLVPVVGLVQFGEQIMADRFTYVPLTGIFIMALWGLYDLIACGVHRTAALRAAGAAVLLCLLVLAREQNAHWRDDLSLSSHAVEVTAGNHIAHNNLGVTLAQKGSLAEAEMHYGKAIQAKPDFADAHYNLGFLYVMKGDRGSALRELAILKGLDPQSALDLYPFRRFMGQRH